MSFSSEVTGVKNFFTSRHVPLCEEWLESCIRWCKDEYLGSNYTLKELQLKIFEQWLLLDLRDVEICSLPPNLKNHKKFVLNGDYSLQLMQIVDISRPKHWQLQRLRGDVAFTRNNWQESDAIGTGKRVLQMTLTDGVQEVEAMEYKPITCLNINLAPGLKVRLTGPVTVRRGVLMLEEHHIKLLGGEVEEIAVSHAAENVLARQLNLPENPNPRKLSEQMDIDNEESTTQASEAHVQSRTFCSNEDMKNAINKIQNSTSGMKMQPNQTSVQMNGSHLHIEQNIPKNQCDYPESDDELRIAQEIDLLLEAESNATSTARTVNQNNPCCSPELFTDEVDLTRCDNDKLDNSTPVIDVEKNNKIIQNRENIRNYTNDIKQRSSSSVLITNDLSNSLDDNDDDIFENLDVDMHLNQKSIISIPEKSVAPKNPVVLIDKLLRNRGSISKGVFKVKAKFKTVTEKLTLCDDSYRMIIKIEDDSGEMDVQLSSDIVSNMTGHCATALISLKSRILENDQVAKEMVLKAISKLKEKLLKLDNIVEVQINKDERVPVVINIL